MRCLPTIKRCVIVLSSVTGVLLLVRILRTTDYTAVFERNGPFWRRGDSSWNMTETFGQSVMTNQPNSTAPRDPVILLIMAYLHTGSTFTGRIFQQHPGTFYEFEPLKSLEEDSRHGRDIHYMDGTYRHLNRYYIDRDLATQAMTDMFTCQHQNLDLSTLSYSFFGLNVIWMRDKAEYFHCLERYRQSASITRWNIVKNCLPLLQKKCENANIRIFKLIRIGGDTVEQILAQHTSVKIIHLVRDPRAMLDSQVRKNSMNAKNITKFEINARNFCNRMLFNLDFHVRLQTRYPNRIVLLRYEDLVQQPMEKAAELFRFINVPFTKQDEAFITKESLEAAKNSTTLAGVWRSSISMRHVAIVDRYCSTLYKLLGYIKYSNKDDILSKETVLKQDKLHLFGTITNIKQVP